MISLVRFLDGIPFAEAVTTLAGVAISPSRVIAKAQVTEQRHEVVNTLALVNRIWAESTDPRGSAAELYLRSRALDLPPELRMLVLRFHAACPWGSGAVPCLIAAFRAINGDLFTGIHRIRLDQPERWPKAERKMLGRVAGSAVKLDAAGEVVCIAEGVETALAARQLGIKPAWALGSTGAIKSFMPIAGVEHLTILGERCDVNAAAADRHVGETGKTIA